MNTPNWLFISFRGLGQPPTSWKKVAGKSPHEMEVDSCANRLCNWFNVPLPYMYTYIMLYSMSIPMISSWMSQIMICFLYQYIIISPWYPMIMWFPYCSDVDVCTYTALWYHIISYYQLPNISYIFAYTVLIPWY